MNSRWMSLLAGLMIVVCSSHGNDADRLFYEGVRLEAKGELMEAIAFYEKATTHSHSANLHGNLANLYFKMNNHGKAILHYQKALLLDPGNGELKANVAQVRNIAGLPNPGSSADDTYFSASTTDAWCWATMSLLWLGLIAGPSFFATLLPRSLKAAIATCWVGVLAFGAYASWRADGNIALLTRDAVAVSSATEESQDSPSVIALRRYAGDSNDANAELKPGEMVSIDANADQTLKTHVTPDGTIWYLARSRRGGKKGWATNKELVRVLD